MSGKIYDTELVKQLRKGDVKAFDSLFEIYSQKLFGFALKYFKSDSDAEELVQEVFVKVWESRRSLKSEHSFKSYLFTIALNQIRKHFNKKAVSLRYIESLQNNPEFATQLLPEDNDYDRILQQINNIIDQMPERRREIFTKSKIEGKSSKEIASELNITPGTVDNQVSEAMKFIRSSLHSDQLPILLFAALFM